MDGLVFFLIGLGIIIILAKILYMPFKIVVRLVLNGLSGGILLLIFNLIGSSLGIRINITPLTAVIAGFFGVPGIILIVISKLLL